MANYNWLLNTFTWTYYLFFHHSLTTTYNNYGKWCEKLCGPKIFVDNQIIRINFEAPTFSQNF